MSLLYFFVGIILMMLIFYAVIYRRHYSNPLLSLPAEEKGLLMGSVRTLMSKDFCYFKHYRKMLTTYGPIRRNWLPLGHVGVEVSDPQWAKYVLITNGANFESGKFVGSDVFKQAVGENGLVVVNGETHKRYKKILSPAYKLSTLKKSMFIVKLCAERMINLFTDCCRKNKITSGEFVGATEIEVKYLFNKTTLDIAVMFLLDYDLQESCSWNTETFGHYLWRILEMQNQLVAVLGLFKIPSSLLRIVRNFFRFLPSSSWFEHAQTTNKMHDMIESVIETKITELQSKQEFDEVQDKTNSFRSLLEYMLDPNNETRLSRQEIHDLVMTFIIGGHETASISLMFTLYELCKKPEYQTKLRDEVIKVFQENDGKIEWDDMSKKFPFLNAVVKESLRMYPPVPWLPRTSVKPDIIDGHHVPADTFVLVFHSELQRNPDIWPDPDEFKPERFLEPDDTIPWYAWLPFGDGAHKCIGYQFGLIEVTYLLATVIKNFKFSVDPKINYQEFVFVSLNCRPAMKLYVTPL